jgi:hypothetical protein
MGTFFPFSLYFVFISSLFALACCILSLVGHSKKGQILCDLFSCHKREINSRKCSVRW